MLVTFIGVLNMKSKDTPQHQETTEKFKGKANI